MRVVFMGTPAFAVPSLEMLIHNEYEVVAVYTQPDRPAGRGRRILPSPVKEVAVEHNIQLCQPDSLKKPGEIEKLKELSPDVIVVAAFGQILRQEVLEIPPCGCINIHASLLPRHRGAAPIPAAILEGDLNTGVTIMLMDKGMDTGPVLAQAEEQIHPADTTGSLTAWLADLGATVLMETLPKWLKGEIAPVPQDDSLATYTKLLTKEQGAIDWNLPAEQIWRKIRAFQPWPGCYTSWQGRVLKVTEATFLPGQTAATAGVASVLDTPFEGSRLAVGTGEGLLVLKSLQLEGKREMSAEEFLRGNKEIVGVKLGQDVTKGR